MALIAEQDSLIGQARENERLNDKATTLNLALSLKDKKIQNLQKQVTTFQKEAQEARERMEKGRNIEKELHNKISKLKAELILSASTEGKLHERMGRQKAEWEAKTKKLREESTAQLERSKREERNQKERRIDLKLSGRACANCAGDHKFKACREPLRTFCRRCYRPEVKSTDPNELDTRLRIKYLLRLVNSSRK